jgi:hypothetical protein
MITPELADEIGQQHEAWLNELEGLAIQAIASNDWSQFYAHVVDFQNEHDLHSESGFANIDDTDGDAFTDANLISNNRCTLTQTTTEVVDGEASADRLHSSSADLLSQTEQQRTIGD